MAILSVPRLPVTALLLLGLLCHLAQGRAMLLPLLDHSASMTGERTTTHELAAQQTAESDTIKAGPGADELHPPRSRETRLVPRGTFHYVVTPASVARMKFWVHIKVARFHEQAAEEAIKKAKELSPGVNSTVPPSQRWVKPSFRRVLIQKTVKGPLMIAKPDSPELTLWPFKCPISQASVDPAVKRVIKYQKSSKEERAKNKKGQDDERWFNQTYLPMGSIPTRAGALLVPANITEERKAAVRNATDKLASAYGYGKGRRHNQDLLAKVLFGM